MEVEEKGEKVLSGISHRTHLLSKSVFFCLGVCVCPFFVVAAAAAAVMKVDFQGGESS